VRSVIRLCAAAFLVATIRVPPALLSTRPVNRAISIWPGNRFCFADPGGKPLALIGDYTWYTFSDVDYDYVRYFDSLRSRGLNYSRVWLWWGAEELPTDPIHQRHVEPFLRPGPGTANDGRPKYDLGQVDPTFVERLRALCAAARQRGVNVQLICMDAWMIKHSDLWRLHAFNRDNNVNGVDGDPGRTGVGTDGSRGFCSMGNPRAMQFQKALVRAIVQTTNSFSNVIYEVANENYYSEEWELALGDYIHEIEGRMPLHHLVMRRDMPSHSYVVQRWEPTLIRRGILGMRPLRCPLVFDTDWTINKNDDEVRAAMWTALVSGGHFNYMDDSLEFRLNRTIPDGRAALHRQIDLAAKLMRQVRFWQMTPSDSLIRGGDAYAMASRTEVIAYLPKGGRIVLDTADMKGRPAACWYDARDGAAVRGDPVRLGTTVELTAPGVRDWVLVLK